VTTHRKRPEADPVPPRGGLQKKRSERPQGLKDLGRQRPDSEGRQRRVGRRAWLAAGIFGAGLPLAAGVDGLLITPRRLEVSEHAVGAGHRASSSRLRIVQVSDLHLQRIGSLEQRVLEAVHDTAADLVVFTGDMIARQPDIGQLDAFLGECPKRPRMAAVIGNWEYWAGMPPQRLASLYERHGIELLVNRSITFDQAGRRIRLTGLDDSRAGAPDARAALVDADPCQNHILLAHCPVARDASPLPPEHPATFMLSGHTHGGQIAPFGIPMVLPEASGGYVAGWYRDGGTPMYVSRGIGTSLLPIRIGSTPEVARFDWSLA